ncbi:alanine racemase [Parasedimentitalea maritima]|uniref:YhfX family PLP-dependent enzyme n=1 Tax=Parasedimentitalea maritima TaxID=2578117 RepID=A0A6A4RJA4_9RHOB|nr:alanine racemase [Zongyanglinia marina]KAE9630112.1 YhfX family PLP-dependent enzyme [Zongyanglinia marina]
MFLDTLIRRNPAFIEAAMELHQQGKIPANSYVLDLDTVERNAKTFSETATKLGLKTFAMTKQVARHSGFCQALIRGGIARSVAVDMDCAVACHRAGLKTGHLGHLVQVPRGGVDFAASQLKPDYWTVFSHDKAKEAAAAAAKAGRVQNILARIQTQGDTFYRGHEGGFSAEDICEVADQIDALEGARFAGITTFPALLFDLESRSVKPTPNLDTLKRAAAALAAAGRTDIEINAPGTNSAAVLPALAAAGATQCEPGNALHGTTPLHAMEDLPEEPAVLYLSEVSHQHGGNAFCFGGGLYIDPVFPKYDVKALVSSQPTSARKDLASVEVPDYSAIDYYGMIDATGDVKPKTGDTVVFGFRGQAFVTRANVVGISGVSSGNPQVTTIENIFGQAVDWPEKALS